VAIIDAVDPAVERVQHAGVVVVILLVVVFIVFAARAVATRKKRESEWNALGGEGEKLSGSAKRPSED